MKKNEESKNELTAVTLWIISIGPIHFESQKIKDILSTSKTNREKMILLLKDCLPEIIEIIDFNSQMGILFETSKIK